MVAVHTVLDALQADESPTLAKLVDATGFTEQTVDRILGELMTAGVVPKLYGGRRPLMY